MKLLFSILRFTSFALLGACLLSSCGENSSSAILESDDKESSSSELLEKNDSSSSQKMSSSSGGLSSSFGKFSSSRSNVESSSSYKLSSSSVKSSSSSSQILSSSTAMVWTIPKENHLNPGFSYGEFVDIRDNHIYKTIDIHGQVWMAENLNYADSTATPSLKGNSWCPNDDIQKCAVGGRLYTWAAAVDSIALLHDADNPQQCGYMRNCELPKVVQGICPDGWHLPSYAEWKDLIAMIKAGSLYGSLYYMRYLASNLGWNEFNSNNYLGFSAVAVGLKLYEHKSYNLYDERGFGGDGEITGFWASTQFDTLPEMNAMANIINSWSRAGTGDQDKRNALSIRCLKDSTYTLGNSWNVPKDVHFNPSINYGELVDERDGHVYRTVKIGEQNWMAENLNFDYNEGSAKSFCFNRDSSKCEITGRYYSLSAALDSVSLANDPDNPQKCGEKTSSCKLPQVVRGVCPAGWHLPSKAEWDTLITTVGGTGKAGQALKSRYGWSDYEGSDDFGFSVVPWGVGSVAYFWVATTACLGSMANGCGIAVLFITAERANYNWNPEISYNGMRSDENHYSVRCVQDEE